MTARASLIVAMTKERLIGRDNDLPWHWPEDLKHFKASTRGQTVVMGRRSFDSLGGKPLPARTNVVVSRSQGADAGPDGIERDGVRIFGSLPDACAWVARAQPDGTDHLWILGGSSIFGESLAPLDEGPGAHARLGLPLPDTLVVTWCPRCRCCLPTCCFPSMRPGSTRTTKPSIGVAARRASWSS